MQITMFLTLGLLVVPAQVIGVWGSGLLLVSFLAFVARPVSVFAALIGSGLNWRDKALVAWVGLRGATPIILATFPLLAGVGQATRIFDLVFFVVTISVLLKATSLRRVAIGLGVDVPPTPRRRYPLEFVRTSGVKSDLMEVPVPSDSAAIGRAIVELGLPKGTLVVLLGRGKEFLIPSGSTIVEQGDSLLVLADRESLRETRRILHVCAAVADTDVPRGNSGIEEGRP
jgi:cell volume regulation protein A